MLNLKGLKLGDAIRVKAQAEKNSQKIVKELIREMYQAKKAQIGSQIATIVLSEEETDVDFAWLSDELQKIMFEQFIIRTIITLEFQNYLKGKE